MRRLVRVGLLLAVSGVIGAAAACSGGSGTPHPTPSPTPFTPTNCQIVWFTARPQPDKFDAYILDMPVSEWTTGTKSYDGSSNTGRFLRDFDPSTLTYTASGTATAGTFAVTVSSGTLAGESLAFTDVDAQVYEDGGSASGQVVATGGTGSFHGVFSDPSPAGNPSFGSGTIALAYQGTDLVLGMDATFALCYRQTTFEDHSLSGLREILSARTRRGQ